MPLARIELATFALQVQRSTKAKRQFSNFQKFVDFLLYYNILNCVTSDKN